MRQSTTTWIIIAAVVIVLGALAIFGFARGWWRHGDHDGGGHHEDTSHGRVDGDGRRDERSEPSGEMINGVRVIEVRAMKFEFEPATIIVGQSEKVRLKVTSQDVTHGIGIEAFDIDRKLEPGKPETIEFTADRPGRHHFHCTVYCGAGHGDMHGELVVLEN